MSSLTQIVFPENLRNDENKFRIVTFSALETPNSSKNKDKAIQEASTEYIKKYYSLADANLVPYLKKDNMSIQSQVVLPYPNVISDSQEHSWNKENGFVKSLISGVGNLATGMASEAIEKFQGGKKLKSIASTVTGDMSVDTGIGQLSNYIGVRKPMTDSGIFQNYTGSNPRNFTMAYTFIPNNSKEAQKIKEIILWFKMYSSPTLKATSAIMLAPYCFNIDFGSNPYISEMFNMKCAVITNLQVEYGSDGSFQLFQDGFPKQINLSISFAESELTYANAYGAQEQTVANEGGSDINSNPQSATPSQAKNVDIESLQNLDNYYNI